MTIFQELLCGAFLKQTAKGYIVLTAAATVAAQDTSLVAMAFCNIPHIENLFLTATVAIAAVVFVWRTHLVMETCDAVVDTC